ncbi:hypothetical protein B0H10DRAFT_2230479 [Mycena sp. CBHHK59/15]|nr:hypothetical protein B0H10DRAFT_2230479 [Mycena sp. CBHHK59/15]
MQLLSTLIPFLALAVSTVSATPLTGPVAEDVFVPPITFPTAGTVLVSKQQTTITWDASGAPANISNGALLMLAKGGLTAPFILAKDFDLRTGSLEITVPWVLDGTNYEFVLFGDSGNLSPDFIIQSDTPN